jgi:hypothetical protein
VRCRCGAQCAVPARESDGWCEGDGVESSEAAVRRGGRGVEGVVQEVEDEEHVF